LYSSLDIIRVIESRRMRWMGYVMKNAYKVLVGQLQRKRPLGRPRHRWEDIIKMDFWRICGYGVDKID
jgi:hypothetical protein